MGPVFLCQQFVSSSMQDEWPTVRPASTSSTSLSQITFLLLLHPPPVSTSPLSYLATCSSSACTLSSPLPAGTPPPHQPNPTSPTTTNPAVLQPRSSSFLDPTLSIRRGGARTELLPPGVCGRGLRPDPDLRVFFRRCNQRRTRSDLRATR